MRQAAVVLVALFLVNLPFAHQALTDRRIEQSGEEVEATLVASRAIDDSFLVEYRLPRDVDPERRRFSAQVDAATWEAARESDVLAVLVVPGRPADNRPVGEVPNHLFGFVAVAADVVLLVVVGAWWWRRGRRSRLEVLEVQGDEVSLRADGRTLTARVPAARASRLRPGAHVRGAFHLLAEEDLLPGAPASGLEQVSGSSYVVRGQVVDAREGRARLELDDGFRLEVQTGPHRIRADVRDSTAVRGTLWFSPGGGG
ncbi:MAG: hypothetical protein ABWX73_10195 [Marmoricola sp.]